MLRQIVRHLPSTKLFGVDLVDGVKDAEFQSGRGMVSTYAGSTLECIKIGHPFLSKTSLKVPKHWRKNCGSNQTAYFFCLIHDFFNFFLQFDEICL